MFVIGERYRVINHPSNIIFASYPSFYGKCQHVITDGRFVRVQFVEMTNFLGQPIPYEKWLLIDTQDTLHISGLLCMKIMNPSLKTQIRQPKIPSLAKMCRNHISYQTRIDMQGTYIDDVIVRV